MDSRETLLAARRGAQHVLENVDRDLAKLDGSGNPEKPRRTMSAAARRRIAAAQRRRWRQARRVKAEQVARNGKARRAA